MLMKKIFVFIPVFIVVVSLFGQEIEAPASPEFIKWQQEVANGKTNTGDVPMYVEPRYNGLAKVKSVNTFDPVYDLRNEGWVTIPKNQGSCGACWTFTSLGSVESFMLKNGMGTYDFSEQNMRTCHGFVLGTSLTCSGGSTKKAAAYLTRMDGPVADELDLYDADMNALCTEDLPVQYRVEQFKVLPNDPDIVKQSLIDYGALYVNMMYDSEFYNSDDYTYYYDGTLSTDHAVLLCGWDDTKVTAGGTGAWIIKNSWGDSWGENGYFYISYNDTKALSTVGVYPGVGEVQPGDKLYMIDQLGWIGNVGYGTELAFGLIRYEATDNEQINAVGTYVNTEATSISIEIYQSKSGNTLTGLLASVGPVFCDYPGYYKVDLDAPVELTSGQEFYIKVEYNTPGYGYPIPYEKYSDGYSDPVIEAGMCWISSSGSLWTLVGNDVANKERDLCIRAYTGSIATSNSEVKTEKQEIKIFPQPANDKVYVEYAFDQELNYRIFSVDGRTVLESGRLNTGKNRINLEQLSSGVYSIIVYNSEGEIQRVEKLIKE
ncbi:MAG: hypothetical protein C0594_17350 [Marinilabiliales bacterium]|nr:MAG: hypothetical protein C0594_17350 [Marinilabiliales bacterium]